MTKMYLIFLLNICSVRQKRVTHCLWQDFYVSYIIRRTEHIKCRRHLNHNIFRSCLQQNEVINVTLPCLLTGHLLICLLPTHINTTNITDPNIAQGHTLFIIKYINNTLQYTVKE